LPWFWVFTASPGDVWVSGGQTEGVEAGTEHTSTDAHVERNQLKLNGKTFNNSSWIFLYLPVALEPLIMNVNQNKNGEKPNEK
jgi:hypothetical protein